MNLRQNDVLLESATASGGLLRIELSVPSMHCGSCIRKIENGLAKLKSIETVRVNLSTKRVAVEWKADTAPPEIQAELSKLGFTSHISSPLEQSSDKQYRDLIKALAVAGFSAANIMMFSVAVWAGASAEMRQLFHWLSAAIAFPTILYSGRVFFKSAWAALSKRQTNMDVPISIGLIITFAMSFYDTVIGGEHAYFDAATALLFFLLIGRILDYSVRAKTRTVIDGLERLFPAGADVIGSDGSINFTPLASIEAGTLIRLLPGDRVPLNGRVETGTSDIDLSLVNGESTPQLVSPGVLLSAGTTNLTGTLTYTATANAEGSFLADMIRLVEGAEENRGKYRRLSDRLSSYYAPIVHTAALCAFLMWLWLTRDMHQALTVAVSVLIITCPCALALAVPMVQVVAAKRLFESGVLIKDGSALERVPEIDTIIFDKTGTLTLGSPKLLDTSQEYLQLASAIATHSRHPYSRAIAAHNDTGTTYTFDTMVEEPGYGMSARIGPDVYKLGQSEWALATEPSTSSSAGLNGTVLSKNSILLDTFEFEDSLQSQAAEVVKDLKRQNFDLEILSGDNVENVEQIAEVLDIGVYAGAMKPKDKLTHIQNLESKGRKVVMVGDGINDAPALAAASVSIAPATASDISRNSSDFVFLKESLLSVVMVITVAQRARKLIRQNIGFSIIYNLIVVPLAFMGLVTPLIAAVAMSSSSLIVVLNALRLSRSNITVLGK